MEHTLHYIVITGLVVAGLYVLVPKIFKRLRERSRTAPDTETRLDSLSSDETLVEKLQGKRVLVVGGTKGIGMGAALVLGRVGAHVTVVGSSESSCQKAVKEIKDYVMSSSKRDSVITYYAGDLSTVLGAGSLVEKIVQSGVKYDHLIVTVGVSPDWKNPLTSDGIDKSMATMVVARFVIWRSCLKFLNSNARVINVLFSATEPSITEINKATFEEIPTSLMKVGQKINAVNDVMNVNLEKRWTNSQVQIIGTAPGWIKTGLHSGQGFFFDNILVPILDAFVAVPQLEVGRQHVHLLVSPRITKKLTFVDLAMYTARKKSEKLIELQKNYGDWTWNYLESLVVEKSNKAHRNVQS